MVSIEDVKSCLPAELIGVIPEDDEISRQLLYGGKLNKNSSSKESIDMICNKLIYGTGGVFDCTKKYRGFWGNIRKGLRKRV
jgi:septum formation inhibitor-activating ATPase MinD